LKEGVAEIHHPPLFIQEQGLFCRQPVLKRKAHNSALSHAN